MGETNLKISDADLEEMKKIQYEMSRDTSSAAMIDSMLHNNDTTYAVFPDATEAETVDRSQMSLVEQLTLDYNVPGCGEFEEMDVDGKETTTVHLSHCYGGNFDRLERSLDSPRGQEKTAENG